MNAAAVPHRVDRDGALCRAAAGVRGSAWGVYWMLDGGRDREWVADGLTFRQAATLSRELNERDRLVAP